MRQIAFIMIMIGLVACAGEKPRSPKNTVKLVNKVNTNKAGNKNSTNSSSKKSDSKTASMTPAQIAKAKSIISSISTSDLSKADGAKLFKMNCAICHGLKGNMMINGAKDLTKSKLPLQESVAQVYYGKGLMTPYRDVLSETEIVAVCQYIEKTLRK